jgi:hypothetical protein
MVLKVLIIGNKEHLALRNNFAVTKKFLITMFDCTIFRKNIHSTHRRRVKLLCIREHTETSLLNHNVAQLKYS